jgi:cardiolipin synthase
MVLGFIVCTPLFLMVLLGGDWRVIHGHAHCRYQPFNLIVLLNMQLKYLPNTISLFRLLLVLPFIAFFLDEQMNKALYVFIIAALSDGLDGWLARCFNCQSRLGLILDPLADKILIITCYALLAFKSILPLWFVGIVLLRDSAILFGSFISLIILKHQRPISPSFLSKMNTVLQMIQIVLCLVEAAFNQIPHHVLTTLMVLILSTTILSFFHYLIVWRKNLNKSHHA